MPFAEQNNYRIFTSIVFAQRREEGSLSSKQYVCANQVNESLYSSRFSLFFFWICLCPCFFFIFFLIFFHCLCLLFLFLGMSLSLSMCFFFIFMDCLCLCLCLCEKLTFSFQTGSDLHTACYINDKGDKVKKFLANPNVKLIQMEWVQCKTRQIKKINLRSG